MPSWGAESLTCVVNTWKGLQLWFILFNYMDASSLNLTLWFVLGFFSGFIFLKKWQGLTLGRHVNILKTHPAIISYHLYDLSAPYSGGIGHKTESLVKLKIHF